MYNLLKILAVGQSKYWIYLVIIIFHLTIIHIIKIKRPLKMIDWKQNLNLYQIVWKEFCI